MIYIVLFLLGLALGSFLNVVIYRLKFGDSPLRGRSYCDKCKKKISWYDNIPLLSFLILRGKCRYCKVKIPVQYPLIEVLIGLEFVWIYWLLKVNFDFFGRMEGFYSLMLLAYWLILFAGAIGICVYDIKYLEVPDELVVVLTGLAFGRLFFSGQWQVLPIALASGGFLLTLYLITAGRGMGFGDVKLGFLMGLVLGWPLILIAYMTAFLTGALAGVILILTGKKRWREPVAFGPFLIVGMTIAKLWGVKIWQWYQNFL